MFSVCRSRRTESASCFSRGELSILTQVVSAAAPNGVSQLMSNISEFDHRACPDCGTAMRLAFIGPRRLDREDAYERHLYRCDACGNDSRFVFELPSLAAAVWQER